MLAHSGTINQSLTNHELFIVRSEDTLIQPICTVDGTSKAAVRSWQYGGDQWHVGNGGKLIELSPMKFMGKKHVMEIDGMSVKK